MIKSRYIQFNVKHHLWKLVIYALSVVKLFIIVI